MKFQLFLAIALATVLAGTTASIKSARPSWNYITMENAVTDLQKLFAVGYEENSSLIDLTQYLCRVWYESHWVPGKLVYIPADVSVICYIVPYNKTTDANFILHYNNSNTIQVFTGHPSWTSWIPYETNQALPAHFISGGVDLSGNEVPVCRYHDDDGFVYVGAYWRTTSECVYQYWGVKRSNTSLEIFVLNPLGKKLLEISAE